LRNLAKQVETRMANAAYLSARLLDISGIRPLAVDSRTTAHSHHLYILRYDEPGIGVPRERFVEALVREGVPASSGYAFPLYKNPMFLRKRFINGSFPLGTAHHKDLDYASFEARCPVSERACRYEAIWLPHALFLGNKADMDDIVQAIAKVLQHKNSLT
jgi:dTDP-4-amino-4,6-dideoxygalactose transaminase